ncbi:hypothetical protein NDU88_007664 [Pleurodeles waltl]|uniref:Uncharacterized protein n=1 Tax=Pleurodeles waltl TaxID=8319 RepID=A0AAV7NY13_PLEWA|nr:hypothetical protein NDU88_007664 [Pleurodeles waltl]
MDFGAIRKPKAMSATPQRQQGSHSSTKPRSALRQQARSVPARAWHPVLLAAQSARPSSICPTASRLTAVDLQHQLSVSQTFSIRSSGGRAAVDVLHTS